MYDQAKPKRKQKLRSILRWKITFLIVEIVSYTFEKSKMTIYAIILSIYSMSYAGMEILVLGRLVRHLFDYRKKKRKIESKSHQPTWNMLEEGW